MLKDFLQLNNLRGLLVGDFCKDIFIYGKCERLSPEAPVPVFCETKRLETDGMAGNVKNNLLQFTNSFDFISSGELCTKTRFVEQKSNQHILRVDREPSFAEIELPANLEQYDYYIVSDYCKGSITDDVILNLLKQGKTVFVDSKRKDLSIFKKSIIKINEKERKECKAVDSENLIVTLGSNGAYWKGEVFPSQKVEVRDVSGAGDTFFASFIAKFLVTNDFPESIRFANKCATSVVKKSGTSIVDLSEVLV